MKTLYPALLIAAVLAGGAYLFTRHRAGADATGTAPSLLPIWDGPLPDTTIAPAAPIDDEPDELLEAAPAPALVGALPTLLRRRLDGAPWSRDGFGRLWPSSLEA